MVTKCTPGCAPNEAQPLPVAPDCMPPCGSDAAPQPPAPTTATAMDCDGAAFQVVGSGVTQSVPHPAAVQMVQICNPDNFDQLILCAPDGTRVIAVIAYDPDTGVPSTTYYMLDGTPYGGDPTQLAQCDTDLSLDKQAMCDAGVTTFIRWFVVQNGEPTGATFDTDMNGDPYLVTGTVTLGPCAADCLAGCETLTLCDSVIEPLELSGMAVDDRSVPGLPRPTRDPSNPNSLVPLFAGDSVFFPTINSNFTGGTHNWAAVVLYAPGGIEYASGEVNISFTARVTNDGPSPMEGGGTGFYIMYDGAVVSTVTNPVPHGFPAGQSVTQTVTATVPLDGFVAGQVYLAFQGQGAQGTLRESWTIDQFDASATTILAIGGGDTFLRTVCRDCSGAVASTTDTTLDGDPYVVTEPVVSCAQVGDPCKECVPVGTVCYDLDIGDPVTGDWTGATIEGVDPLYRYMKDDFAGTGIDVVFQASISTGLLASNAWPIIGNMTGAQQSNCSITLSEPVNDLQVRISAFGTGSGETLRAINPAPIAIEGDGTIVGGTGVDPAAVDGTIILSFAGPISSVTFSWISTDTGQSSLQSLLFSPIVLENRKATVLRCCDGSVIHVDQLTGEEVNSIDTAFTACVEPVVEPCRNCQSLVLCDSGAMQQDVLVGLESEGTLANGVNWTSSGPSAAEDAARTNGDGAWWSGTATFPNPAVSPITWEFDRPSYVEFSVVVHYGPDATNPAQNTVQLPDGVEVVALPVGYTFDPSTNILRAGPETARDCSHLSNPHKVTSARFKLTAPTVSFTLRFLGARAAVCGQLGSWAFGAIEVTPVGEFLRTICRDCSGAVLAVSDTELDGTTPYIVLGDAVNCSSMPGEDGPSCQACDTIVLADSTVQSLESYAAEISAEQYYVLTPPPTVNNQNPNPVQPLFDGFAVTFPQAPTAPGGGSHYWGAGVIIADGCICSGSTATITVGAHYLSSDGTQQASGTGLNLYNGLTLIATAGVPANANEATLSITADVPVEDLVGGRIAVAIQCEGGQQGTFKSWVVDQFSLAIEAAGAGCGTRFLRTICRDCDGSVLSITDTTDGLTEYVPVAPVAIPAPCIPGGASVPTTLAPADALVRTGIRRLGDTAVFNAKATQPGLQSATLTVLAGDVSVQTADGLGQLVPAGVSLSWSVTDTDDSSLSFLVFTGQAGSDYLVNFTYKDSSGG